MLSSALVVSGTLIACGGSASAPQPTSVLDPQDSLESIVERRELFKLASLIVPQQVPCESDPKGVPAAPRCNAGERPGTPVPVFVMSTCEPMYVRTESLPGVLETFVGSPRSMYAAYREGTPAHTSYVFRTSDGLSLVVEVSTDGGVVALSRKCGQTPEEVLAGKTEIVVPPRP